MSLHCSNRNEEVGWPDLPPSTPAPFNGSFSTLLYPFIIMIHSSIIPKIDRPQIMHSLPIHSPPKNKGHDRQDQDHGHKTEASNDPGSKINHSSSSRRRGTACSILVARGRGQIDFFVLRVGVGVCFEHGKGSNRVAVESEVDLLRQ